MMEHPRDANQPRPGPDCARFADWLPLLTTFTPAIDARADDVGGMNGSAPLGEAGMNALRKHVDGCAWCQAQLAMYQATDNALRRAYTVPTGVAPFLTFQSIASRVAAQDAQPEEQAEIAASGAPAASDSFELFDTSTIRSEKEVRMTPNHEQENPFERIDSIHRPQSVPAPHTFHTSYTSYTPDDSGEGATAPTARRTPTTPAKPHRRLIQGIAALAAAVIIVALFGALFYMLSGHRNPTSPAHATHYLGANGHWQVVGRFPVDPTTNTIHYQVAPSNSQVIYQVNGTGDKLQRSDDGGKTWTTLSFPTQYFPAGQTPYGSIQISPLDPHILILTEVGGTSNPNCPASNLNFGAMTMGHARQLSAATPSSGGYSCTFQYTSRDGGASWTHLSLVDKVKLQITFNSSLQVSGSQLFAFAQPDVNGESTLVGRLMGSSDGGFTWQPVDSAIVAQNLAVEEAQFVATSTGSTLFAVSIAATEKAGDGQIYTPYLWRSDDDGAHWTNEGVFNTPPAQPNVSGAEYGLLAASQVNGQAALYEMRYGYLPYTTPTGPDAFSPGAAAPGDVFVTLDNGHTWQEAVQKGVPAGLDEAIFSATDATGTLSDGSIVMLFDRTISHTTTQPNSSVTTFSMKDAAYYAWLPGTNSWRQLTPSFEAGNLFQDWMTSASDGQPETIWQITRQGNTAIFEKCALTD